MQRPAADHWIRKILLVYILQLFPCKWHPPPRSRVLFRAPSSLRITSTTSLLLAHPAFSVCPFSSSFVSLCRGLVTRDDRTATERNFSVDATRRAWTRRLTRATFESNPFVWDHVSSVLIFSLILFTTTFLDENFIGRHLSSSFLIFAIKCLGNLTLSILSVKFIFWTISA